MERSICLMFTAFLVTRAQDTTIVCPEGKVYGCFSPCGQTCQDYFNPPPACPGECKFDCYCLSGTYLNPDGECVSPDRCSQYNGYVNEIPAAPIACQSDKVFECSSYCGRTCQDYFVPTECPDQCTYDCYCVPGTYLNWDGNCVAADQCTQPYEPPPNSIDVQPMFCPSGRTFQCDTNCGRTCYDYTNPPANCPSQCAYDCYCMPGTYLTPDGSCVTPEQCGQTYGDIGQPICSGGTQPFDCDPSCGMTCRTMQQPVDCTRSCVPGCYCPLGQLLDDNGICVPYENCMQLPLTCQGGKVFMECDPNCGRTCQSYTSFPDCAFGCTSGCYCVQGMYESPYGDCVSPSDCPYLIPS